MLNHDKYPMVRPEILAAIDRWVEYGIQPGDFLTAVLENNLREAFGRADMGNRLTLFHIVGYCHNEIPGLCWGSPEKCKAWKERF